tara:strand:- start:1858 stop:3330 length:1473 start_codon:yes stop_codon:yes gene_type:complete
MADTLSDYYGLGLPQQTQDQIPASNALSGNPISFPSLDAPLGGTTRSRGQKLMGMGGGADLSTKLGALGAMFTNKVPEFRQQMMQEREAESMLGVQELQKREMLDKSLAKDYFTAYAMAENNDYQGFMELMEDRLQLERKLGLDTSSTLEIMQDAQGPDGMATVMPYLKSTIDASFAAGYLTPASVLQNVPASYRALQLRADEAGLPIGSAERAEFMRSGGVDYNRGGIGLERWANGTAIQYLPDGNTRVIDRSGRIITDPEEKIQVLELAYASGPAEAAAEASQIANVTRSQEIITDSLDAAKSVPNLKASLVLLNGIVDTGGFAGIGLRLRNALGIGSGDEAELAYNLRKSVLEQLKPTFGAAFTAREGDLLREIEASEDKSTEGNIRLLNNLLKAIEIDVEMGRARAIELGDSATVRDLDTFMSAQLGANSTGLFNEIYQNNLELSQANTGIPPAPPIPDEYGDMTQEAWEQIWQNMEPEGRALWSR